MIYRIIGVFAFSVFTGIILDLLGFNDLWIYLVNGVLSGFVVALGFDIYEKYKMKRGLMEIVKLFFNKMNNQGCVPLIYKEWEMIELDIYDDNLFVLTSEPKRIFIKKLSNKKLRGIIEYLGNYDSYADEYSKRDFVIVNKK